jgi:hypothetical protein
MTPSLLSVLSALYASEMNVSICISSFWDEGWEVKLGNTVNGFAAEKTFANAELKLGSCVAGESTVSRIGLCSEVYSIPFRKKKSLGKVSRGSTIHFKPSR